MNSSSTSSPGVQQDGHHLDEQHRKLALRVVFLTVFLDILGFGIVIPQLGVYSSKFGAEGWVIGVLGSSYSIMQFLFAPFWGRLSDRIGRRPVLLLSIFGTACGYVLFAFSHSLPLLFASRILDGFTGANISAAQAYVSDVTEPKNRAKMFGLFGAIFGLGFVLGPACGLLLSTLPGNWSGNLGVGLFTATLGFVNWIFAVKFLPETLSKKQQQENITKQASRKTGWLQSVLDARAFSHALRLPGLSQMLIIAFVATAAFGNLQITYTPFLIVSYIRPAIQKEIRADPKAAITDAERHLDAGGPAKSLSADEGPGFSSTFGGDFNAAGLPPTPAGLSWRKIESTLVSQRASHYANAIFVTIGLMAVLVQGALIPFLRKRTREVTLLTVGTVIMALSLCLVPLQSTYFGQFPVAMLIALGNGMFMPILSAMVSEYSPVSERGEVFGVFQSMQSMGRIVGPLMGGFLFQKVAHSAPYFAGGSIMIIAFVLALRLREFCHHEPEQEDPDFLPEPEVAA
jgi:DHA1 family tetracycline resistance protein-like MFS transporter